MRLLLTTLILMGCTVIACHRTRNLETHVGSRRTSNLEAFAERQESGWRVVLDLPVGTWRVEPLEDQPFELVESNARARLRWNVSPTRWSNQDRPFRFNLVGTNGLTLPVSVYYPNLLSHGQAEVFRIVAQAIGH